MAVKYAAHRGFKARYPENTQPAFQAAFEAKCQVIETDVHITSDNEVVIAHDIDTRRVFGENYVVTETAWHGKLDQLQTLREPRSPMPLFKDVLAWAAGVWDQGGEIKLMLDIKADNDPQQLYELVWAMFEANRGVEYWKNKIIWGLWTPAFILPSFIKGWEVINITFDVNVAVEFHKVCLERGVELHAVSIYGVIMDNKVEGQKLLTLVRDNGLKIWFWTLNRHLEVAKAVEFADNGALLEGVVTDDPPAAMGIVNVKPSVAYSLGWWFKGQLYWIFLTLMRRKYNVRPLFRVLQKVGFI